MIQPLRVWSTIRSVRVFGNDCMYFMFMVFKSFLAVKSMWSIFVSSEHIMVWRYARTRLRNVGQKREAEMYKT